MDLYNTTDKNKYEVNIPSGIGEFYTTCPACSHLRKPVNQKKKCFSWNRTKLVGHCYHCGSSFVEYKESEKLKVKSEKFTYSATPKRLNSSTPKPLNIIDPKYLKLSLGLDSNFGEFLKQNFYDFELDEIMKDYYLGMTKNKEVIYWYIDKDYRIRSGKIMQYNALTGKRVKSEERKVKSDDSTTKHLNDSTFKSITWVHSILKNKGELTEDWDFSRCLFGEHLLTKYPEKDVMLFEGEKTAIICSKYFPDNVCLATGGAEMLTEGVCEVLRGRKVYVIPDYDKVSEWKETTNIINKSLNLGLIPFDGFYKNLSKEQKALKLDMADLLFEQYEF